MRSGCPGRYRRFEPDACELACSLKPTEEAPATSASRNRPLRILLLAAFVGLALLGLWRAGLLFSSASDKEGSGGPSTLQPANASIATPPLSGYEVGLAVGKLAPNFEFSTYDGQRLRLSDFRGRPVYVNFWASWCEPCKQEMPNIQAILNRYQQDNLAVVAVNNGEDLAPARKFLSKLNLRFTAFAFDPDQDIVRRYSVAGMPTSVFIDAQGLITRVIPGEISLNVMDSSVRDAIIGAGKVEAAPR